MDATLPSTSIDAVLNSLRGRRAYLIEELTKVERALCLVNEDQRVQELRSLLYELGGL